MRYSGEAGRRRTRIQTIEETAAETHVEGQAEQRERVRSRSWNSLFVTAVVILAIGSTVVYGLNRDVVKQSDGIKAAQSKMDVPLAPP